jgi:hypothetical protein
LPPYSRDVQDFSKQPGQDGVSNCFHLTGAGGGRVCLIHVALTSSLVNSTQVRVPCYKFLSSCKEVSFTREQQAGPEQVIFWGFRLAPTIQYGGHDVTIIAVMFSRNKLAGA